MMDDLISRQAAVDEMRDMYYAAEKWGEKASEDVIKARAESCMASLIEMKLRIEKLPSAVVRCRDCKYYAEEVYFTCSKHISWVKHDDFCSYAERKDNEDCN